MPHYKGTKFTHNYTCTHRYARESQISESLGNSGAEVVMTEATRELMGYGNLNLRTVIDISHWNMIFQKFLKMLEMLK